MNLQRLSLTLFGLSALLASALAQADNPSAVLVNQIAQARSQILVVAPTLGNFAVSEALRQAVVGRGVKVYILAEGDPRNPSQAPVNRLGSYLPGLALLGQRVAGIPTTYPIQIRLVAKVGIAPRVVVDNRAVLIGQDWYWEGSAQRPVMGGRAEVVAEQRRFLAVWEKARPCVVQMQGENPVCK